ncbi:hypothetical protein ACFWWM_20845 [Streptomyces sp. NPDC058682]|uniref:hypothetical protein n=1 Tax=Streptomyces sp. NPDC058682 TaxID=3346596 RepID=UPI00365BDB98
MPQHAQPRPVCRDCDGFATATITTGTRTPDGARDTVRVHCPACRGLGRSVRAVLVPVGR